MITFVVYWLASWVGRIFLLPIYTRMYVVGRENIPRKGPLIIVSNHLNDCDPGIICSRFPRRLVFMAKVELFQYPGLKQFMNAFGAFPVRRNEADLSALRRANETLDQDLALVLFPEGTRSGEKAQLIEAWPGAALIALRNDAPILPVAITGSQHLGLPKVFLRLGHRDDVTLTIGKPFTLPKPPRVNAESARASTQVIMEQVAALLPPAYRGYYGSAPEAATSIGPNETSD